jgi:predicted dehydrogenase
MACQAGKDVYLEKPLAKTIDEGRAIATAAQKHNRILQMGSQWRNCRHMLEAAQIVRSGKLGRISMMRAWANLDWQPKCEKKPDGPPPATVDYDLWLGPAPRRPFNPNRFHYTFRWYWDYAGGMMTDWGVHLLNMLSMGIPLVGLKSVRSSGVPQLLGDDWETPGAQCTIYEFPDFMLVWEHLSGYATTINNHPWGIAWYGSEGIIMMNDAGWEIIPERRKANLDPEKHQGSGNPRPAHVRNFLDCVVSRQQPALNAELGHQLSTIAHLGNIAYQTGSIIKWDAAKEKVLGNPAADKLVGVKYRSPWKLPYSHRS